MRFILIAFALMGWGFYELSGGSEFDPNAVRAARIADLDMDDPVATPEPETVVITQAPEVVVDTAPPLETDVTRVSLNLTTLEPTPTPVLQQEAAEEDLQQDVNAALEEVAAEVPQNVSVVTSSADTPAIIPSLIAPQETAPVTEDVVVETVGFQDIRTVSGNRVNVRGGPGTDFGVVGRLVRGDEISVLEDNGAGWVRFETPDGATAGWMADFLLTEG